MAQYFRDKSKVIKNAYIKKDTGGKKGKYETLKTWIFNNEVRLRVLKKIKVRMYNNLHFTFVHVVTKAI